MRTACVICQSELHCLIDEFTNTETMTGDTLLFVGTHAATAWEAQKMDWHPDVGKKYKVRKVWCNECDILYNHSENITTECDRTEVG